jgi:hypothetical protein
MKKSLDQLETSSFSSVSSQTRTIAVLFDPEWSRDARRVGSRASSFSFQPPSPRGVVQAF